MSIYLGSELLGGTSHDTVSNAHSLLDYKWTDHKLNEMAWLRADTWSWQSGKVYEAAYNHLLADLSSAELKTETFNGITITYYVAKDGHKIAYESEIIKVSDIFESLGTAWWYIIDIPNKRFKLPRSTHGDIVERYQNGYSWYRLYADNWCEQGGQTAEGTSITVTLLQTMANNLYTVQLTCINKAQGDQNWVARDKTTTSFLYSNSESFVVNWEVKGKAMSNVSAEAPSQYLYFYVGDYSQSAIEQTAGITTEELANKVDTNLENTAYSKLDVVIDYQIPTAENNYIWYRLYKSGWVEQGQRSNASGDLTADYNVSFPITMADTNYTLSGVGILIANYGRSSITKYVDHFTTSSSANLSGTGSWVVFGMADPSYYT